MIDIGKIYETVLGEALTIPPNKEDKTEEQLRKRIPPRYEHADRVIRWYRLERKIAQKTGADPDAAGEKYLANFGNLMDSLKMYDKLLVKARLTGKLNTQFDAVDAKGRRLKLAPKTFLDQKFMTYKQAESYIGQFARAVNNELTVDIGDKAGAEKYMIKDEDRPNIRLVGQNAKVCVWATKGFETTNKFVFQLWQNADTMDDADAYGDPDTQSPYCTHVEDHWDNSSNGDPEYQQFWYLTKLAGVEYTAGDLNNPGTIKTFNALKGTGPKTICALNDSESCWNDRDDSEDRQGEEDLIDKMVNGRYNFNGCGRYVQELYHACFEIAKPDVPEDEIQYIVDSDEMEMHLNTKPRELYTYLKAGGPRKTSYMTQKKLDIHEFSCSDYMTNSQGGMMREFKNGLAYPMPKTVKCIDFNIDLIFPNLRNFPEHIAARDTTYGGNLTIIGAQDLTGCPKKVDGMLRITECDNLNSFNGLNGEANDLIVDFDGIGPNKLDGLEKLHVYNSVELNGYKGNTLRNLPQCVEYGSYGLKIEFAGQDVSLIGLPDKLDKIDFSNASGIKSLTGLPLEVIDYVYFDSEVDSPEIARAICIYNIFRMTNLFGRGVINQLTYSGFREGAQRWISDIDQRQTFFNMADDERFRDILTQLKKWRGACVENETYYTQHDEMFPEMTRDEAYRIIELLDVKYDPCPIIKDIDYYLDVMFGEQD